MKSTRSVGCNHFEEMYVIHRRVVCNQPEGKYTCGDAIHATRDYIRLTAITSKSFGLDKRGCLIKKNEAALKTYIYKHKGS